MGIATIAFRGETPAMSSNFHSETERRPPKIGGSFPRLAFICALCPTALAIACSNGAPDQLTKPVALGMTSATPPYYSVGNTTIYEVQIPVALPVRRPTAAERNGLGPAPAKTPYSHAPFLRAEDESVEIHYVLSNVSSTKQTVWLLIDPWNEFVRYRPGITVVNDEVTVPNLGYEPGGPGFVLEPKSRTEGTITSDDMHEIAIKLASVEKLLASSQAMSAAMPAPSTPSAPRSAVHAVDPSRHRWGDRVRPWPAYAGEARLRRRRDLFDCGSGNHDQCA